MTSTVNAAGDPIPTSAVLMATSKHIGTRCREANVAFLKCKKNDANPEKCLDKGQQVTRCVLGLEKGTRMSSHADASSESITSSQHASVLNRNTIFALVRNVSSKSAVQSEIFLRLKDLHHSCTKEMDSYAGCMYYNTDEFELCRKEQKEFEKACPL